MKCRSADKEPPAENKRLPSKQGILSGKKGSLNLPECAIPGQHKNIQRKVGISSPVYKESNTQCSLSPVFSESWHNFCDWTSSIQDDHTLLSYSHTYVNIMNCDSTRFENISQMEKLPSVMCSI